MRKTLIALTVVLAAAGTSMTPAHAKGKGFKVGVGVGLLLGGALLHHHHRHHSRPIIVQRPVVVPQQPVVQQPAALPVARTADDQGRTYDLASRSWFDGRDRCWSGAQAWSFQGGSWFYGQAAWYESNGQWMTNAANPPAQVDCARIPVFAARVAKGDKTATVLSPGSIEQGPSPRDVVRSTPSETEPPLAPIAGGGIQNGGDAVVR